VFALQRECSRASCVRVCVCACTGLDSAAALKVMAHLRAMAAGPGGSHTVLASVHQPRAAMWDMVDSVRSARVFPLMCTALGKQGGRTGWCAPPFLCFFFFLASTVQCNEGLRRLIVFVPKLFALLCVPACYDFGTLRVHLCLAAPSGLFDSRCGGSCANTPDSS